jgi:HEAT repeat protein
VALSLALRLTAGARRADQRRAAASIEQAVFALSQRPTDDAVPGLIRIARTNGDGAIRRKAVFWLGQTDEPRAMALFEDILQR